MITASDFGLVECEYDYDVYKGNVESTIKLIMECVKDIMIANPVATVMSKVEYSLRLFNSFNIIGTWTCLEMNDYGITVNISFPKVSEFTSVGIPWTQEKE